VLVFSGPTQARPVRVEQGHPAWWLEITRAWDRFYGLRSYRARADGPRGDTMMWEVVRRGPSADADDLRMVWSSRDGKYRQETVQKAYEVWQASWRPRIRNPEQARREERAMRDLAYRMGATGVSARTTASHHIWCYRMPRPVLIMAPDPEIRRLESLRGGLDAVRITLRRQGTHVGPDRVMRSVTVYEYQLKDPREGRWTLPQTLAVDNRTGLPVQASLWVARGSPGPGGFAGSSLLVPPAGRDWRPGLGVFEYYDHNAPFTITVPPAGCR
jgi:hypothetical protein